MAVKMESVRFIENCVHSRYKYRKGQVVPLPDYEAKQVVDRKVAVRYSDEEPPKAKK